MIWHAPTSGNIWFKSFESWNVGETFSHEGKWYRILETPDSEDPPYWHRVEVI